MRNEVFLGLRLWGLGVIRISHFFGPCSPPYICEHPSPVHNTFLFHSFLPLLYECTSKQLILKTWTPKQPILADLLPRNTVASRGLCGCGMSRVPYQRLRNPKVGTQKIFTKALIVQSLWGSGRGPLIFGMQGPLNPKA